MPTTLASLREVFRSATARREARVNMPPEHVRRASESSQLELRALDVLLASTEGGPPTCSALVRAWYALLTFDAALREAPAPSYDDFLSTLAGGLECPLPVPLRPSNAVDSRAVVAAISNPPPPRAQWPDIRAIRLHREAIARCSDALGAEMRLRYPRRTPPTVLVALCAAAALLAGLAVFAWRPAVWRVEYFRTRNLADPVASDLTVDIGGHWGAGSPHAGVPSDEFSSRWETCLVLARPADVLLSLGSDDGSRLMIDERPIIEQWKGQSYTEQTAVAHLSAGAHYVRVEHFEISGDADLVLLARLGGRGALRALPRELLRAPGRGGAPCARFAASR